MSLRPKKVMPDMSKEADEKLAARSDVYQSLQGPHKQIVDHYIDSRNRAVEGLKEAEKDLDNALKSGNRKSDWYVPFLLGKTK